MNRQKYIPALAAQLQLELPELNIYEDYRDGTIEYPCVIINCDSEEIQDWSPDHSTINLEVIVIVPKSEENPTLPNEINELVCSDTINDAIIEPTVHYVLITDSNQDREDHTTEYTTSFEIATYNNAT